ncbi:hypothetical protein MBM09_03265 [Flaviramulus sp. BrNp1-15]|uniref:hypothetical protein n=1 Tax=Flaviramulus sp. BrNp1-15 TaxID=2916754 RepID=UPI001EE932C7|nr:hypothetical protein [Flaviramulus sp. BrNp1-15]ULC60011.1 hypothetical protein MBM09_03265 [Flaviramulus sp. BrNp1-15]
MPEKLVNIKEVTLKNNCPECYSKEGLHLTFKQKITENKFFKSITSDITNELFCKMCNSVIYPVQWTDDIDRVVDYQKKAFAPKKPSTYLKKLSWIVIITIAVVIAAVIFAVLYSNL